jgi:GDP-L-fucose synthase
VYPRYAPQPIKEDCLLTGPLEITNRSYALAKLSGIEMCSAYNRQYGTNYIAAMPANLYGPNDNYDPESSHVLAALIRKIHRAILNRTGRVLVWGTGTPRREFLYSDDAADACILLMGLTDERLGDIIGSESKIPVVNVGYGEDVSIRDLTELIAEITGVNIEITFDSSKPDGTERKRLDTSIINSLGWYPRTSLRDGISKTYREYCACYDSSLLPHR